MGWSYTSEGGQFYKCRTKEEREYKREASASNITSLLTSPADPCLVAGGVSVCLAD